MEDFSRFARRWLPVVLWMVIILVVSTDLGSAGNSHRLLKPFLRWFNPSITEAQIYDANIFVRKVSHVLEFAILAILVWRTREKVKSPLRKYRAIRLAGLALAVCAFFAISTEIIQYTTRYRGASVWDVLINMGGASLGLIAIFSLKWLRHSDGGGKSPRVLIATGVHLENAADTTVLADLWHTIADTRPDVFVVLGPIGPPQRAHELLVLLKETSAPAQLIVHLDGDEWANAARSAGVLTLGATPMEFEGVTLTKGPDFTPEHANVSLVLTHEASVPSLLIESSASSRPVEGFRQVAFGPAAGPRFVLYDAAAGGISGIFPPILSRET